METRQKSKAKKTAIERVYGPTIVLPPSLSLSLIVCVSASNINAFNRKEARATFGLHCSTSMFTLRSCSAAGCSIFLKKTRAGMIIPALESPLVSDMLGAAT